MATASHKACTACGLEKAASDYYADKRAPHGLCTQCKQCMNERKKARRALDPEAYRIRWRKAYRETIERQRTHSRNYYYRHHEARKAENVARYHEKKNNPAYAAARQAYRLTDEYKLRFRAHMAQRRALMRGGASPKEVASWAKKQRKVCYWCANSCADDFHIDHYVPLSKGGGHTLDNLRIACPPCNSRKHAKDPLDFAREVGRLF